MSQPPAILTRMAQTLTLTQRLQDWLAAHPGAHAPVDIANDIGESTHTVAARLLYLAGDGRVKRHRTSPSSSLYSAPKPK